jgi:nicotinamidase/pyrazinamidase
MSQALIVVDVQNGFMPGGSLAVPHGDEIIQPINELMAAWPGAIFFTQDWHPKAHISFASTHHGKRPFDVVELSYGQQVLWPDHCVQGTWGAQFAEGLVVPPHGTIVRKGMHRDADSYSGFEDANGTETSLEALLFSAGVDDVTIVGLALDYCVKATALHAALRGFHTTVLVGFTRAVDEDTGYAAKVALEAAGVILA